MTRTAFNPAAAEEISTIVGSLARYAASRPDRSAYVDAQVELSFGALYQAARRGAAWLTLQGVQAGDTVALPLDNSPANAPHALAMPYAIAHVGAVTLPLHPEVPPEMRMELIGRHAARWLIASLGQPQLPAARVLDPRSFDAGDPRYDALPAPRGDRPESPLIYLFTSGTTGAAKVLLPSNAQMHEMSRATVLSLGLDGEDRLLAPLPWPSGVSVRYVFHAHCIGAAFVSAPIGETRTELRDMLARFRVTRIGASPWQIRRLLLSAAPAVPIPPLRSIRVTGAFLSPEELEAARVVLTPNVCVGYGFNEIGAVALLAPGEAAAPGYVGRLFPGVAACVTGARGEPLPPGGVGDLAFRVPGMCTEYANNPAATRERFRDGWFYPGDAGSIDATGRVSLLGRTQDVINYGGLKIWPGDIEAVLKQHPDVLDAALVGLPDPQAGELPMAFLVPRMPLTGPLGDGLSDAALREFCATRIDAARVPPLFMAVAEIPRNETGKVMRNVLIDAYLQVRPALLGKSG